MMRDASRPLAVLLHTVCVAAAVWFILCFLGIALFSIHYPYHLEWMEGQAVDVIARVVAGLPLYVEPTIAYVPFIYTPLYFYVAGWAAQWLGVDFFVARLVSLISALGVGAMIYAWIRREQGTRGVAMIGAGLFYATYPLSSRWFDVARIDSFYVVLLLAALFVFTHQRHARASVAAGLLFAAAFFTKQNALIVALPVLVVTLFTNRNHALITAGVMLCVIAAGIYLADHQTDGWFSYYVFEVPASHRVDERYIVGFWTRDLLAHLWPVMAVAVWGWCSLLRQDPKKAWHYAAVAAGLIGAAYAGRLHRYGWQNVLIPAHLALALCAGLALAYWMQRQHMRHVAGALAALAVQMALLLYPPIPLIPNEQMAAQGDAFMEKIATIEGEVFMPGLQFISTRLGKQSYSYGFAAIDVRLSHGTSRDGAKRKLRRELDAALMQRRFGAVVTNYMMDSQYMQRDYREVEQLHYPRMVTGHQPRQPWLLLPRKPGE